MSMVGREFRSFGSPSLPAKHGTEGFRKTAKIVSVGEFELSKSRAALRDLAPDLIGKAFSAPSRHETCKRAAEHLGVSPDTILRIIDGGTMKADTVVLCAAAGIYARKFDRQHPLAIHLMKLMGAL